MGVSASTPPLTAAFRQTLLGDERRLDDHEPVVLLDDAFQLVALMARNDEEAGRVCSYVGVLGRCELDLIDARGIWAFTDVVTARVLVRSKVDLNRIVQLAKKGGRAEQVLAGSGLTRADRSTVAPRT
jgi:hypothetical protein